MNATFVKIDSISGSKASYYSLVIDNNELSEFDDFQKRMREAELDDYLDATMAWLQEIADSVGCSYDRFKNEGAGEGVPVDLPPYLKWRAKKEGHSGPRLYCQWLHEGVVILFNGGIKKTAEYPQDCKYCEPYFNKIFHYVVAIKKCLHFSYLKIDSENKILKYNPGFILQIKEKYGRKEDL